MRKTWLERNAGDAISGLVQDIPKYGFTRNNVLKKLIDNKAEDVELERCLQEAMWYVWLFDGNKIYKIAERFGEQLDKCKLDISCAQLPNHIDMRYIEFPDSMDVRDKFNARVIGALVQTIPAKEIKTHKYSDEPEKILQISFVNERKQRLYMHAKFMRPNETLEDLLDSCNDDDEDMRILREFKGCISFTLKCMIYLGSGDPDLREYRPPYRPLASTKKKQDEWDKKFDDVGMYPCTLVGFEFMKERIYHVDEAQVRGHFRWQPWGEERKKVKLIWIDEHVRHYKNDDGRLDAGGEALRS